MPERTARIVINNRTGSLRLVKTFDHLCWGEWTPGGWRPPAAIEPGAIGGMQSESDGVLSGTEGYVKYDILSSGGRAGMIYIYWDNPWLGVTRPRFAVHASDVAPDCDFEAPKAGNVFEVDPTVGFRLVPTRYGHTQGGGDVTAPGDLFQAFALGPVLGIASLFGLKGIVKDPVWEFELRDGAASFPLIVQPVGEPALKSRTRISAVTREQQRLQLFGTGRDGVVRTSWWREGQDWSARRDGWQWPPLGGVFPAGAPVTTVARQPEHLDAFVTGNDGRVYTSWWHEGQHWSGVNNNWASIGGFFPAGAPIAATSRSPGNLDLFITGNDGRVYTSWWYEGQDWSGIHDNWANLGGFFPAGASVTALARRPDHLDLFITGNDGRVYTSWWHEGQPWSGVNNNWASIGGSFPAGAPIAATSRSPGNLDLFITGNDGRVYTSWWYDGYEWAGVNDNWRAI
jgi:hypothetical protein